MQPYVFPYLGYFQLIHSSKIFIFYDDVNYIKQGWINRNKILVNNTPFIFTVPVSKGSQNSLIKDVEPYYNEVWINRFYKQISQNYKKAPYYNVVIDMVMDVFQRKYESIADLAIQSIENVFSYLKIPLRYGRSSQLSPESHNMPRADRLAHITKYLGYSQYVNSQGGKSLYSKYQFAALGVELYFLESLTLSYRRKDQKFVAGLSVIDCLMFNDREEVKYLFSRYKLV